MKPPSALAELSGKKLMAVDGAALNLTAIEGGIERDITAANGRWKRPPSPSSMTGWARWRPAMAASAGGANVTGFFRLTDNGVEVRYADGKGETFSALDGGVMLRQETPGASAVCRSLFPEGHAFSDAEKKAAVAEYAIRLGLAPPETKPPCPGDVPTKRRPPSRPPTPKPEHHAEAKPARPNSPPPA